MYSPRHNNLFREHNLDEYLSNSLQSLSNEVEALSQKQIEEFGENELAKTLIDKYSITAPVLAEDQIKIDAKEAQITEGSGNSRLYYENGSRLIKGLAITATIPFMGDSQLFQCMPSTYSLSGTPDAQVFEDKIVLTYETTEKDPEKIKLLWLNEIAEIKQNLAWIDRDTKKHNDSLGNIVKASLASRKKEADDNQSLIDKLKQG